VFFKTAIQFRSQLRARMGIFPYPIFASALVLSTGTRSGTPTRRPTLSGRETDGRRAPSDSSVPDVRRESWRYRCRRSCHPRNNTREAPPNGCTQRGTSRRPSSGTSVPRMPAVASPNWSSRVSGTGTATSLSPAPATELLELLLSQATQDPTDLRAARLWDPRWACWVEVLSKQLPRVR
jgi:hypothetical protein